MSDTTRYHHTGETWRDPEYGARFGFAYVPQPDPLPRRAVLLPLLGAALGAAVLTGFWIGVACFDWLACVTVSN